MSISSAAAAWQTQIVPAQLAFLAIYNPSLGPTDDTFANQLLFSYSRAAHQARSKARKTARSDGDGGDALRSEENEKLRQIGLAQGIVDFAHSFSAGQAVDHIDTDKSRIVLHELEPGWWILASIDLTRLPSTTQTPSQTAKKGEVKSIIEYSSREVSTPALLVQQLIQAHYIFSLHLGPSLSKSYVRLGRDRLSATLGKFWLRFSRTWDVLLHGNPAADVFSGLKLSSGGELGMGVGEEEWGSGERDVLEDFTRQTDGLVDLVAARFGDPAPVSDQRSGSESDALPWLGSGCLPQATDGIIFGGIGGITRPSLRNISLWMREIYTYGDHAYGMRDNPLRERRKRPKHDIPPNKADSEPAVDKTQHGTQTKDFGAKSRKAARRRAEKTAPGSDDPVVTRTEDHASTSTTSPAIPPPIVRATENALDRATRRAESNSTGSNQEHGNDTGTTMGIPDQYMKYLTLGLSTLAKTSAPKRPELASRSSTSKSGKNGDHTSAQDESADDIEEDAPMLSHMEPIPDGETLHTKIAIQKRLEEKGTFVVGWKGDLDDVPNDEDTNVQEPENDLEGPRNVLRTVQVEITPQETQSDGMTPPLQHELNEAGLSQGRDYSNFKKLRILVYVQRPFMYCLLFEQQTPALSIARLYKDMHRHLTAIHKSLLCSTNAARIAQRIEDAQTVSSESASVTSGSQSTKGGEKTPIYDLLYNPALLTVHTNIPNIPEPGTPAAEGITSGRTDGSGGAWTRIEALNVHSQVLNTLASVQRSPHEYERTSKTSRGWWVVWMKLPPSIQGEAEADSRSNNSTPPLGTANDTPTHPSFPASLKKEESNDTMHSLPTTIRPRPSMNRMAFLIRKANDSTAPAKTSSGSRAASSMWNALTLRPMAMSDENTGGSGAGWGPAALAGGIGFDARKYVDGLLSLNR